MNGHHEGTSEASKLSVVVEMRPMCDNPWKL